MSKIDWNDKLPVYLEVPYKVGDKVYYTIMYPSQEREFTPRDYSVREAIVTDINKDYVQLSSSNQELHYSVRPKSKGDICQLVSVGDTCMFMVSDDKQVVASMIAQFTHIELIAKESQKKRLENELKMLKVQYDAIVKEYNLLEEDVES